MFFKLFFILFIILITYTPALGYVGPGLGLGAIGVVLGVLFSVLLALLGIFWYPMKRLYKKFRNKNK